MANSFNSNSITELAINIAEAHEKDLDHMFYTIYYYYDEDCDDRMDNDQILDMIDFYRKKTASLIEAFRKHLDD